MQITREAGVHPDPKPQPMKHGLHRGQGKLQAKGVGLASSSKKSKNPYVDEDSRQCSTLLQVTSHLDLCSKAQFSASDVVCHSPPSIEVGRTLCWLQKANSMALDTDL